MHREHQRWFSPALDREMDLLVFGHAGARMLVFPSSMGRFYEWEDQGMIGALDEHLKRGWLQLYCVDRVGHHARYDRYLHDEVLPLTRHRNQSPFLITTGASFGAYHALTFALRYP